jgi:hypothetical protein
LIGLANSTMTKSTLKSLVDEYGTLLEAKWDSQPAYGNLKTGKVVAARSVGKRAKGGDILVPDLHGPAVREEWMPGVFGADGNFHPGDLAKIPVSEEWFVTLKSFSIRA